MECLNKEAIISIEKALQAGYDVEVRHNKYGITVASVSKKLVCKGTEIIRDDKTKRED